MGSNQPTLSDSTGKGPGRLKRRLIRILIFGITAGLAFTVLVPVVEFTDPLGKALLDRKGRLLGACTAADGQWRFGELEEIPEKYKTALLEFEDHRFFLHPGVDPLALARAAIEDLRAGEILSGGSTITMQVVRLSRRGRPRTLVEKSIECVLALRLEMSRSKQEILSMYAAHAPFGGNTVGLQAAAWRYFGRAPDRLSWAEAATLAVLPNAPSLIHPGRRRERLRRRRDALLVRLHQQERIDALTLRSAMAENLPSAARPMPRFTPHLLDRARKEHPEGGMLRTSLDLDLQKRILRLAEAHHRILSEQGIDHLAALVAETRSGKVLAYVGNVGPPEKEGSQVDIIMSKRSSGSILKPFLYSAMLQGGEILPRQLIADIPTRIAGFAPRNFDRRFSGAVPAATALSRSLNVPAVRMLRSHGIDRFGILLRELGLKTLFRRAEDYGLSLILGGAEVRLFEAAGLYAGMGRSLLEYSEQPAEKRAFCSLSWCEGDIPGARQSPFDAGVLYTTLEALLEVSRPGIDISWRSFSTSAPVAWKTGTSYGFRDAWAFGLTPAFTVGVWAGNADGEGRPGLTGHSAAAPLLFSIFDTLPKTAFFEEPEAEMQEIEVCAFSGFIAGVDCGERKKVRVPRSCLPGGLCPYCRRVHLDSGGRYRVDGNCEKISRMQSRSFFILPPAMAVEYRRRHPEYRPLPPWRQGLSCSYPENGAEIYVPLELDGLRGRLVAEAAEADPEATVFWHLDRNYLGATRGEHRMPMAPEPGTHTLTLVDSNGATISQRFRILPRAETGNPR